MKHASNAWFGKSNGTAEVQCDFFGPISGLGGEFLEVESFWGPLLLEEKNQKIDPRIRAQNSGVRNSFLSSLGRAKSPILAEITAK